MVKGRGNSNEQLWHRLTAAPYAATVPERRGCSSRVRSAAHARKASHPRRPGQQAVAPPTAAL
eukprot:scaffold123637_cov64-Phaeocystis_antarctica.AAC.3